MTTPSSLSDAFKSHPIQIKPEDLNELQEVPDSYTWTDVNEEYPTGDTIISNQSIPVIDLSNPNAIELIGNACKSWGVFQVINHGVPVSLVDEMEKVATTLFSLPSEQKLKAARPPGAISGYGLARIASFSEKRVWSEGFCVVGSQVENFKKLWPQDYATFCDVVEKYEQAMQKLAGRLMWLVLYSLGITEEDVEWAGPNGEIKDASAALQLNSYPTCPDPDRAMGLPAHTDSSILTILYQSNTSGLQVRMDESGWVTVPPIQGAFVVNLGDLLHIISNGSYRSILHRAMVNQTRHRLSIVYFHGPPADVQFSPLSKLVGPNQPPIYRAVTWKEYLSLRAKHGYTKAISALRL